MFHGTCGAALNIFTLLVLVIRCSSLPTTNVNGTRSIAGSGQNASLTRENIEDSSAIKNVVGPIGVIGSRYVEIENPSKIKRKRESKDIGTASSYVPAKRGDKKGHSVEESDDGTEEADDTDSKKRSRYNEKEDDGAEYDDADEEGKRGLQDEIDESNENEDVERERRLNCESSSSHVRSDNDDDVRHHSKREGSSSVRRPRIWDQWGKWSSCSVTCGVGKLTRWRHCVAGSCSVGEKEAQLKTCTFAAC